MLKIDFIRGNYSHLRCLFAVALFPTATTLVFPFWELLAVLNILAWLLQSLPVTLPSALLSNPFLCRFNNPSRFKSSSPFLFRSSSPNRFRFSSPSRSWWSRFRPTFSRLVLSPQIFQLCHLSPRLPKSFPSPRLLKRLPRPSLFLLVQMRSWLDVSLVLQTLVATAITTT